MQDQENIKLCTYNIVNGLNGRLTFALKNMKAMGISLGILTETKLVDDMYPINAHGYTIIATSAKNHHQGGVALFHKTDTSAFTLEGTRRFGPNIIRTTLSTGLRRWTVIGIYVPPSETDGTTLNYLQLAYNYANNDEVILLGDINVNLDHMANSNHRQDETAALISSMGLHDLRHHYRFKDNLKWTWRQLRNGTNITSVCDYICTTNIKDFKIIDWSSLHCESTEKITSAI
jgi:exonuclease III